MESLKGLHINKTNNKRGGKMTEERTRIFNKSDGERTLAQKRKTMFYYDGQLNFTSEIVTLLLIDISGSTGENISEQEKRAKILGIIKATTSFIINLKGGKLAIVVFDDEPRILHDLGEVHDKQSLIAKIEQLSPGGRTDFYKALLQAEEIAERTDEKVRVIFLSDGCNTSDKNPVEIAERLKRRGATIDTILFGSSDNSDMAFLRKLASSPERCKSFLDSDRLTGFLKDKTREL
jgi:uncharacterized protein YegL